jgi:hypothetical protein
MWPASSTSTTGGTHLSSMQSVRPPRQSEAGCAYAASTCSSPTNGETSSLREIGCLGTCRVSLPSAPAAITAPQARMGNGTTRQPVMRLARTDASQRGAVALAGNALAEGLSGGQRRILTMPSVSAAARPGASEETPTP